MMSHGLAEVSVLKEAIKHRAQRFPIQTALQFRESGDQAWSSGTTVNISRTGVLFRCEKELEPKALLEMLIEFPEEGEPANLLCWGPVVRKDEPRNAFAAQILNYRFVQK